MGCCCRWIGTLGIVAAGLFLGGAPATALTVISSPQNTGSPFKHNLFHSADRGGGWAGDILSWFALDTSVGPANFYDPVTGALQVTFDIFSDSALTSLIGTAEVTSVALPAAPISDLIENDVVFGTTDWSIDLSLDPGSTMYAYLTSTLGPEIDDEWDLTISFADVLYATSPQNRTANTFANRHLSLWGADGTYVGSKFLGGPGGNGGFGSSAVLGVDLVLEVIPEPTTGAMVLVGLVGLGSHGRRTKRLQRSRLSR